MNNNIFVKYNFFTNNILKNCFRHFCIILMLNLFKDLKIRINNLTKFNRFVTKVLQGLLDIEAMILILKFLNLRLRNKIYFSINYFRYI